jgi:hypothetical protein
LTQTAYLKSAAAKKWIWISEPIIETKLANQIWFCICSSALPANGLRYLRVGGRGQGLGAGKTRSEENAW